MFTNLVAGMRRGDFLVYDFERCGKEVGDRAVEVMQQAGVEAVLAQKEVVGFVRRLVDGEVYGVVECLVGRGLIEVLCGVVERNVSLSLTEKVLLLLASMFTIEIADISDQYISEFFRIDGLERVEKVIRSNQNLKLSELWDCITEHIDSLRSDSL